MPAAAIAKLDDATFATRLRDLVTGFYMETESTYFHTIYNTQNARTDLKEVYDKVRAACGGELDWLKLLGGLENLSHLRTTRDMNVVVAKLHAEKSGVTDEAVRSLVERWPHRARKELDIRVPRWHDDQEFVRKVLEQALASYDPARDADAAARSQKEPFLAERARALAATRWRPFLRRKFLQKLELMRTYAWWREEMRDHSSYAYHLVRLWTVDAARRLVARGVLGDADDVWYLSWQDVLAAVEGSLLAAEARARSRLGRRVVRSFRNFEVPGEVGQRYGFAVRSEAPAAGALKGIACSPGRVEGRARVVLALEDAGKVAAGDVLVTVFTDPGWTPLLGRVSAVVTETGGLLSHAAVISREYGIPAVLAVADATRVVRDGDTVVVDGSLGTVEVKKKS